MKLEEEENNNFNANTKRYYWGDGVFINQCGMGFKDDSCLNNMQMCL